ncbi:MAG: hypothetical protein U0P30_17175 [Vicinamibacterales bacterium]
MRQFERTLGETLLERRGRRVVVTEVGRLDRYAEEIAAWAAKHRETLKGLPTGRAPSCASGSPTRCRS